VEKEINTQLPGTAETSEPTEFVDEVVIQYLGSGRCELNDEVMDSPRARQCRNCGATLMRAKQGATRQSRQLMVTIVSEPDARYSRAGGCAGCAGGGAKSRM